MTTAGVHSQGSYVSRSTALDSTRPLRILVTYYNMSSGLRSPVSRSDASSPRPRFDSDLLRAYMKKLLSSTFQGTSWPGAKEQDRVKDWIKDVGTRVKERMLEIQPQG